MKWNGTVSHRSQRTIASRFATAKTNQASSTPLRCSKPVSGMANRFDRRARPELLAQPADADVDDVRARIEVVTPDLGKQPLTADDLARALEQAMEKLELAVGEIDDAFAEPGLAPREIECDFAGLEDMAVRPVVQAAQVNADPCKEFVERERLRHIVARSELEPVQLRRHVGSGRDDHDGQVGLYRAERAEQTQPVEPRQEQIEDDE